jgi:hypothetical protein
VTGDKRARCIYIVISRDSQSVLEDILDAKIFAKTKLSKNSSKKSSKTKPSKKSS